MSFLVDTNIISEFTKTNPNVAVVNWLTTYQNAGLYLSVVTVGEIQQGIFRLPEGQKRKVLLSWLNDNILKAYARFLVPLDTAVMLKWGELSGTLKQQGRSLAIMDSLIAATALQHQLTIVTRNTSDFVGTGVQLINPFQS